MKQAIRGVSATTGLFDRREGKASVHRIPLATAEQVLALYQEKYFDLNVRHFHEKLREEHGHRVELQLGEAGAARSRAW